MKERKRKILLGLVALITLTASVMIAFATNVSGVGKAFGLAGHATNNVSATDFSVPTGSDPWGTTFDSSGMVWVALPGCDPSPTCANTTPPGKLAVFNPTTQTWVRSYTLPAGFGQPLFLAFDQQGRLWFPMPMTNSLGMLDTSSGTFQQWAVPTASSGPWDVAVDHNGNVWFTEHYTNQIAEFNPSKQAFTEIATPTANSDPYGITVDASNNIWFTENNPAVALIGEYTAQGQLKEYKIRNNLTASMNLTPHLITIDHSGNIWWSEGWVSMFGELNIAQAVPGTNNGVTEYSYQHVCSNCGTHTSGIAVDSYGNVWFDDSLQNEYGYMPITGGTVTVYAIPTANGHSHDGLNIDSQNRVWFTEEFPNKLALATQSGSGSSSPTPTTPTPTATNPPGQGAVLGQDTFQRANQSLWGTASDGQQWSGDANTFSGFSIANNSGQIGGNGLYSAVLGPQVTDSEVLMSGSISKFSGANFGAVLHWTDTNDWYKAYLDGANLIVQKKVKGSVTTLKQTAFSASAGTPYNLRFRIVGTTLYAKAWPVGNSEPSGWMITTTDSSLTAGYAGLRAQTQGGSVVSYNSFLATSLTSNGSTPTPTLSPTVTVTPSPTVGITPSPSPTVGVTPSPTVAITPTPSPTPTLPPSGTTIAQDTFQRANQALWGAASDSQTWGGDANTFSGFSIANNAGTLVGNGNNYNAVLGPQVADSQVSATGSINRFNYSNFGVVLRWQDTNNWYKAYIDGANLVVQKKVNGVITTLGTAPFTASANTSYNILFQAVGTTLSAKVWPSNTAIPGNWMVTANDSSFQSGYCGLRISAQPGSTVSYTAFTATQLP